LLIVARQRCSLAGWRDFSACIAHIHAVTKSVSPGFVIMAIPKSSMALSVTNLLPDIFLISRIRGVFQF